jgi:hypothetical protein
MTVAPTWAGVSSALPVVVSRSGWLEVRVVVRPPATQTAWVKSSDVTISRTPFHVVVDLSRRRLMLFHRGGLVMCAPAGIGAPQDPTPAGSYFLALLAQSPDPAYGPFVIVTSAFSDKVTDWEQSGEPVITIEGPLDSAAAIGTKGAAITNGSVRLLTSDLNRLRSVPLGTRIDIVRKFQFESTIHDRRMCRTLSQ